MNRLKSTMRALLAAGMMWIGTRHFANPAPFVAIVPPSLPHPDALVAISGACEIAGGAGLLFPPTRRAAAWGLVLLYMAVFPANVNMALHNLPFGGVHRPLLLWLRLPLQAVFITWAWWLAQPDRKADA